MIDAGNNFIVVPAKRSASRDPYAAATALGICGSRLCLRLEPVVMGPCFRRDDQNK
jgi:hypothetical protein